MQLTAAAPASEITLHFIAAKVKFGVFFPPQMAEKKSIAPFLPPCSQLSRSEGEHSPCFRQGMGSSGVISGFAHGFSSRVPQTSFIASPRSERRNQEDGKVELHICKVRLGLARASPAGTLAQIHTPPAMWGLSSTPVPAGVSNTF